MEAGMTRPADIPTALRQATALLDAVSDTARLDAELLMAIALKMGRMEMLAQQRDLAVPDSFAALLERRHQHEPIAYIAGEQAFWDLTLHVTPDVLIPRADSETLITAAYDVFGGWDEPGKILDLGTGSGALLLAALSLFPHAKGYAIDASEAALCVASNNADRLGLAGQTSFMHLSWCDDGWADILINAAYGTFDLILCNPPYVESNARLSPMVADYEPQSALFSGPEGLDDYNILLPILSQLLAPGGIAIFEIGHEQAQNVSKIAIKSGLDCELRHDLAGKPRALIIRVSV